MGMIACSAFSIAIRRDRTAGQGERAGRLYGAAARYLKELRRDELTGREEHQLHALQAELHPVAGLQRHRRSGFEPMTVQQRAVRRPAREERNSSPLWRTSACKRELEHSGSRSVKSISGPSISPGNRVLKVLGG